MEFCRCSRVPPSKCLVYKHESRISSMIVLASGESCFHDIMEFGIFDEIRLQWGVHVQKNDFSSGDSSNRQANLSGTVFRHLIPKRRYQQILLACLDHYSTCLEFPGHINWIVAHISVKFWATSCAENIRLLSPCPNWLTPRAH